MTRAGILAVLIGLLPAFLIAEEVTKDDLIGTWDTAEGEVWDFENNYLSKMGFGYTYYYEYEILQTDDDTLIFFRSDATFTPVTYTTVYKANFTVDSELVLECYFQFGIQDDTSYFSLPNGDELDNRLYIPSSQPDVEVVLTRQ